LRRSHDAGTPGGEDVSGVLLDWCSAGLIVGTKHGKMLVAWDSIRVVELVGE
jgi:hypothetical protein